MRNAAALLLFLSTISAAGQNTASPDNILQQVVRSSTLAPYGQPFHAVMEINPGPSSPQHDSPGASYKGRIEVWWADAAHYRLSITSPDFSETKTVDGEKVKEEDQGTFRPHWIDALVRAIIDPVPLAQFSAAAGAQAMGGSQNGFTPQSCIRRDDRPGGITDQLTWGQVCFTPAPQRVESVITFPYFVSMQDWRLFGKEQIARAYETAVNDYERIVGHLTTLEPLAAADAATITVSDPTPPKDRIQTSFVSTLTEEGLVEHAPQIDWPPVREGRTEGYMIVYARTDRTGEVRESATHNSDNPGLSHFGMEQALHYKFKPLLVDGVPQQMEMPLVLHFSSHIDNPIPVLTVDQMKPQIISCHPDPLPSGVLSAAQKAIVRVSIDESGNVAGSQPVSSAPWGKLVGSWMSVKNCHFRPLIVSGKPTFYKGDIDLSQR